MASCEGNMNLIYWPFGQKHTVWNGVFFFTTTALISTLVGFFFHIGWNSVK